MHTAFLDSPGVVAMAHRGFSGANGDHRLENSLAAFKAAAALGLGYVETDVHATADGVLLAFHDETLDRVTDATGRVCALPWSTVRQARIGGQEPIPRLDELLEELPSLRVNIDVKSHSAIGPTISVIERHRAHDRVCIASFSDSRRRAVVDALSRPVATSGGQRAVASFVLGRRWISPRLEARLPERLADLAIDRGLDALQVPERAGVVPVVTAGFVRAAHARGLQVHVWTVDDEVSMNRLLDLGVDGLISDRADILKRVLQQRGQWPAP